MSVTACFPVLDGGGGCLRARVSVGGFLVHPTDRLPVPGCKQTNKIKYKM